MLSDEEISDIKKKLISHIETNFPPEQAESAIAQIEEMNAEELESFLKKNKIIAEEEGGGNCIFCSIASGKINSCVLMENENAIAVLDINPISKGQTLVVQKEHSEELQKEAKQLAEKVSEKIKKKLKPKKVEFAESKLFGHATISVLPVYTGENFSSEKNHATIEELEEVKKEIGGEEEKEIIPEPEEEEKFLRLPKRFP